MTRHDQNELTNLAANVLRDCGNASIHIDDPIMLGKLIERAARHYHETMSGQAESSCLRDNGGSLTRAGDTPTITY